MLLKFMKININSLI